MDIDVAFPTVILAEYSAMGALVTCREMALTAQLPNRLRQETVIRAAVRSMTLGAPASFDRIGIYCLMLVEERSTLLGMAITTDPLEFIRRVISGFCREPMATQAGYIPVQYRMNGHIDKPGLLVLMTAQAELGAIIQ